MSNFRKAKDRKSAFNRDTTPIAPVDPDRLPPIFSFEYMADRSGYSVECCDGDNKAALAQRLFKLSRMTWLDIRASHRHSFGTEKIARNAIRPPLPLKLSEDVTFLALRYNGMAPMVGFREGRVFNVIFLDHDFSVYAHG